MSGLAISPVDPSRESPGRDMVSLCRPGLSIAILRRRRSLGLNPFHGILFSFPTSEPINSTAHLKHWTKRLVTFARSMPTTIRSRKS